MGDIFGGGDKKSTSVVTQQPSPPQIAPEFQPYAGEVGRRALQRLNEFDLGAFKGDLPLQVPGITDLQRQALQNIQERTRSGIPIPRGEQQAINSLPWLNLVSQSQIGVDPIRLDQFGRTRQLQASMPGITMGNPFEHLGVEGMQRFASGDFGNSPAVQAATQQIAAQTIPLVSNQMAKAGLGRSGALQDALTASITGNLLPIYQQGLAQQLQASQGIAGVGGEQAARTASALLQGENLLQNVAQTIGGRSEDLQSDTVRRMLETGQANVNTLRALGATEYQRDLERLNAALQGGALERDIFGQQAQARHADVLRRQALSETFGTALLGAIPSLTTFPQQTTESTKTPSSKK